MILVEIWLWIAATLVVAQLLVNPSARLARAIEDTNRLRAWAERRAAHKILLCLVFATGVGLIWPLLLLALIREVGRD